MWGQVPSSVLTLAQYILVNEVSFFIFLFAISPHMLVHNGQKSRSLSVCVCGSWCGIAW